MSPPPSPPLRSGRVAQMPVERRRLGRTGVGPLRRFQVRGHRARRPAPPQGRSFCMSRAAAATPGDGKSASAAVSGSGRRCQCAALLLWRLRPCCGVVGRPAGRPPSDRRDSRGRRLSGAEETCQGEREREREREKERERERRKICKQRGRERAREREKGRNRALEA